MEKKFKELNKILEDHYNYTKLTSQKILEKLKEGSKDYGELTRELEVLKRDTYFHIGNKDRYISLFNEVEKEIVEEINNIELVIKENIGVLAKS